MGMTINVDDFLTDNIMRDLRKAVQCIPAGRVLRLIRIPTAEFNACIERVFHRFGPMMFRPVVLSGIPIDMTTGLLPEAILVADDNTNLARTPNKEIALEI